MQSKAIELLEAERESANIALQKRTDALLESDLMGAQLLCVIALTTKLINELSSE